MNEEFEEQWKEIEKKARENFENGMHEAKRLWMKSKGNLPKKKTISTFSVAFLVIDPERGIPIYQSELFSILGTHLKFAQTLKNEMSAYLKTVLQSVAYKKSVYQMYVEMVDEYEMKPTDIYPLLHTDYDNLDAKDKRKFQNNLRTNYTRLTRKKA